MERDNVKVAVLLSSYNGENFILEQLESILVQEGVDVDIYLRDDNSTDSTLNIVKKLKNEKIKILVGFSNIGPIGSFRELILSCPEYYQYYAFSDQDDYWCPRKLQKGIGSLSLYSDKPALYCSSLTLVNEELSYMGIRCFNITSKNLSSIFFQNYATGNTIILNDFAFSLVRQYPPPLSCVMHDWWILILMHAKKAHVQYDAESNILYRQHGGNVLGMHSGVQSLFIGLANLVARISSCLVQLELLLDELEHWDQSRLRKVAWVIVDGRHTFLRRVMVAVNGHVKGRTFLSSLGFAVGYMLFGGCGEKKSKGEAQDTP